MGIRIAIAFSNMLFAEGVKRFFDTDKTIEVVDVLEAGANHDRRIRDKRPDVVLVDLLTLYNGFKDPYGKAGFILFDTTCGEENITSAVISKGVSGVLNSNAGVASLKRAVRAVAGGELFLGKKVGDGLQSRRVAARKKAARLKAKGARRPARLRP